MWEHTENMVGTQKEKNCISTPPLPPPKKDEPSLMQILFPKVIRYHIFGLNLIPFARAWAPILYINSLRPCVTELGFQARAGHGRSEWLAVTVASKGGLGTGEELTGGDGGEHGRARERGWLAVTVASTGGLSTGESLQVLCVLYIEKEEWSLPWSRTDSRRIFFPFFPVSQCVLTMFPLSS